MLLFDLGYSVKQKGKFEMGLVEDITILISFWRARQRDKEDLVVGGKIFGCT